MIKYYLLAILAQLLWAIAPSASQVVISHISVESFAGLRWILAGTLFLVLSAASGRQVVLSVSEVSKISILGIIGFCFGSLGTLYALKLGGVVNFTFLTSVYPVLAGLVCIVVLREKIKWSYYLAAPFTMIGLLVLASGKYELSGFNVALYSVLLVMLAAVCEATPFAFSKKITKKIPLPTFMGYAQIAGGATLLAVSIIQGDGIPIAKLNGLTLLCFLYVSIVSGMFCYGLLCWLLRKMDGHRLTLFDGFHAIFGSFFGWIFFSESINMTMIIGASLLLLSIYIANSQRLNSISISSLLHKQVKRETIRT